MKIKLGELLINFDSKRKPLSKMVREKMHGPYPYYGAACIFDYVNDYIFDGEYILLGEDGTVLNENGTPILQLTKGKFWPNNHTHVLKNNEKLIDFQYLYYLLKNTKFNEIVTGAVQQKISQGNMNNLIVEFEEDRNKQKKIASVLSSIDDKIRLNNKLIEDLESLSLTVFKEEFINSKLIYKKGTFSDLIINTLGGDWGKEHPEGNNCKKVFCVRGADIPEVQKGNKGKMPYRYILPKNYLNKQLKNGDLVVEISGGSPTQSTGRICYITQSLLNRYDSGMVCTNFCRAVTPKDGFSLFVYLYWLYLYNTGLFFNYENGTTGIKNFDLSGFITQEEINIPEKSQVDEFSSKYSYLFDKIYSLGLESEKLSELRDTLLPKLMSGEIDASSVEVN